MAGRSPWKPVLPVINWQLNWVKKPLANPEGAVNFLLLQWVLGTAGGAELQLAGVRCGFQETDRKDGGEQNGRK